MPSYYFAVRMNDSQVGKSPRKPCLCGPYESRVQANSAKSKLYPSTEWERTNIYEASTNEVAHLIMESFGNTDFNRL